MKPPGGCRVSIVCLRGCQRGLPRVGYPRRGRGNGATSAAARSELAQPGGDGLLVTPGLTPPRSPGLTRGDGVLDGHGGRSRAGGRSWAGGEARTARCLVNVHRRVETYRHRPGRTRTNWFVVRSVETDRTVGPLSARSQRA